MRTDQQPVRIALFAPSGRMGRAIQAAIADDPEFELSNDAGEVLIDLSAPDALRQSLDRAVSAGVPLLIGTTGLLEEHHELIAEAAGTIPVLRAPNTSLGVARLDIRCAPTGRMHPLPVLFLQVFRGGMLVGDIHSGMSSGTITSWRVLRAGERDYLEIMVAW